METLKQEILTLLAEGTMTPGEIRNWLNSQQAAWDVSQSEVISTLHSLLKQGKVALDQHSVEVDCLAQKPSRMNASNLSVLFARSSLTGLPKKK